MDSSSSLKYSRLFILYGVSFIILGAFAFLEIAARQMGIRHSEIPFLIIGVVIALIIWEALERGGDSARRADANQAITPAIVVRINSSYYAVHQIGQYANSLGNEILIPNWQLSWQRNNCRQAS